jgi:cobalt-zinc-cadmium resistance protein CzcA
MVGKLIDLVLRERFLIVALSVLLIIGGLYAFRYLNIEAYPDPAPPIIEVIAQNPGWSAEEMERQITVPIETQLNGMPGVVDIRSISLWRLSYLSASSSSWHYCTAIFAICGTRYWSSERSRWG